MPHLKCVACRCRLHSDQTMGDGAPASCPGCGLPLEPVVHLTEILGYQVISTARRSQDPSDVSHWLDDGEGFPPEPMAKAVALPRPDPHA
jgi:hypothetical protein